MAEISKRERAAASPCLARYWPPSNECKVSKPLSRRKDVQDWLTSVANSKIIGSYVDRNRSEATVGSWLDQWLDSKRIWPTTR